MQLILDPEDRWLGKPGRASASGNKRPVAIDDAVSVLKDSGPVTITVLSNDYDPEGGPLELVSAFAALGTAVAEPDNTVSYTPPSGVSGFDTVIYEIADDLGQLRAAQINVTIAEPVLSVTVQPDSTIVVNAETGFIDITITEPGEFAGVYQANVSDLAGGPISLVPPSVVGAVTVGGVLTAAPGLWIYDVSSGTPTQSWQWRRAGIDISGETSVSYLVAQGDVGQGISVTETLTNAVGQRFAESQILGASFTPSDDPALIGWWDADDAATLIADGGGAVSNWVDKAGSADLLQGYGPYRPQTGVRQMNGRNVVDFGGSDDLGGNLSLPASGNFACHMVLELDSVASAFAAVLAMDATNDFQIDANSATQFDGRLNLAGMGTSVSLGGGPFSGAIILSAMFDRTGAGTASVFVGDVIRGTTAYSTSIDPSVFMNLMTNRSQNSWVSGAVAELIITGDVTNRSDHTTYLTNKWGIA
jgi:Bacterial Ig domain